MHVLVFVFVLVVDSPLGLIVVSSGLIVVRACMLACMLVCMLACMCVRVCGPRCR